MNRKIDAFSRKSAEKKDEVTTLKEAKPDTYFKGIVKILRRFQPGPTIIIVTDGTGVIEAVSKECEFDADEVVELAGFVEERAGKLQIEIRHIEKSDVNFDLIIDSKSEPKKRELSIKSEKLNVLEPYFFSIAKRIRKAIFENQPILIRHHADADGITSGIAIEKACRGLMAELGIDAKFNIFRSPSKAPFYEIIDVLRDISFTKKLIEGHGQKKPLIIVLDNGSTPEDVFAMKMLKTLGFDIIVIDHHNPVILNNKKTAVCPYVKLHLNPYIEGFNGKLSAGMLSYETARLIFDDFENALLPAISAVGDRCDNSEAEEYIARSGLTKDEITEKVIAIDFLAYHLKFDEATEMYDEVFTNKDFVKMINEEVRKGVETQLQSTLPYLRTRELTGVIFSDIDLEKYTVRFKYPTPGKVIGMIHDEVAKEKEGPVITIGYLSDMIIIRATKPILPIASIIEKLRHDFPEANVDGGGHECAGTIKFVSAHLTTIIESIKQQIRNLDYIKGEEE